MTAKSSHKGKENFLLQAEQFPCRWELKRELLAELGLLC